MEIIFVPPTEDESAVNLEIEPLLIDSVITTQQLRINQKIISSKVSDWTFIPFNFRHLQRNSELVIKLNNLKNSKNISIDTISDFEKHWRNKVERELIIDIYKSVPGSLNTNSMTLYSGPLKINEAVFNMNMISPFCLYSRFFYDINVVGCIYFGDYNAIGTHKWNQFKKKYGSYWDNVSTVQIPHHGSHSNYNNEINLRPKFSIMSAGHTNTYHHPHVSTIKQILFSGGIPLIVSEFSGTLVIFEINIYPLSYLRRLKLRKLKRNISQ